MITESDTVPAILIEQGTQAAQSAHSLGRSVPQLDEQLFAPSQYQHTDENIDSEPHSFDEELSLPSCSSHASGITVSDEEEGSLDASRDGPNIVVTVSKESQMANMSSLSDDARARETPRASGGALVTITAGGRRTVLSVQNGTNSIACIDDGSDELQLDGRSAPALLSCSPCFAVADSGTARGSPTNNPAPDAQCQSLQHSTHTQADSMIRIGDVTVSCYNEGGVSHATVSTPLNRHQRAQPIAPSALPAPFVDNPNDAFSTTPIACSPSKAVRRGRSPRSQQQTAHREAPAIAVPALSASAASLCKAIRIQEQVEMKVRTLLRQAIEQRSRAYVELQSAKDAVGAASSRAAAVRQVSIVATRLATREAQEARLRNRLHRETLLLEALVLEAVAAESYHPAHCATAGSQDFQKQHQRDGRSSTVSSLIDDMSSLHHPMTPPLVPTPTNLDSNRELESKHEEPTRARPELDTSAFLPPRHSTRGFADEDGKFGRQTKVVPRGGDAAYAQPWSSSPRGMLYAVSPLAMSPAERRR